MAVTYLAVTCVFAGYFSAQAEKIGLHHWYKNPEWWLVIVGFLTGIAAVSTLLAIKEQAGITERQTQTLVDSERAWLVPASEPVEPNDLPTTLLVGSQIEIISIKIRNCGRTPAWLIAHSVEAIVLEDTDTSQFPNAKRRKGELPNPMPFPQARTESFFFEWKTNRNELSDIKTGKNICMYLVFGNIEVLPTINPTPPTSAFIILEGGARLAILNKAGFRSQTKRTSTAR